MSGKLASYAKILQICHQYATKTENCQPRIKVVKRTQAEPEKQEEGQAKSESRAKHAGPTVITPLPPNHSKDT